MRYKLLTLFGIVPFLSSCQSTMDQAGKFSVDFTNAGGDPIVAGFYLLMNAFSDEAARARVAETISSFLANLQHAAEPISTGLGFPEVGAIATGATAIGLGIVRAIRGPASTRIEKETLKKITANGNGGTSNA